MSTETAMRTQLTKAGNPTMGTVIEVHVTLPEPDDAGNAGVWERCTVVGKGHGGHANELRAICVEWGDGARQWVGPFADLIWRPVGVEQHTFVEVVRGGSRGVCSICGCSAGTWAHGRAA